MAPVILNNLYKNTALESSFSVSNIVIVDGASRRSSTSRHSSGTSSTTGSR